MMFLFFDDMAIHQEDDRIDYGEVRKSITGISIQGRFITAIWTMRDNKIRLITAFKPSKQQIKIYGGKR